MMSKWRGDGLPMASQLRRWLPFCKQLLVYTSCFERQWADVTAETVGTHFECVHQKAQWVQSRGSDVSLLMRDWIRGGMDAVSLFDISCDDNVSGAFLTAQEWMHAQRLHLRAQKRARRETVLAPGDTCQVACVVNEEIASLEHLRTAMVEQSLPQPAITGRFDELAHGITAHVRNVHCLTGLALRVAELATKNRIVGGQMNAVAEELGQLCGNADVSEFVHGLISESFQRISALTTTEILSKAPAMTQRQVDAMRLIVDGVRMLSSI